MILFRQYFRAERDSLIGWSLGLFGVTWLTAAIFPGEDNAGMAALQQFIDQLPASAKALLGHILPSNTLAGWLEINVFSFLPLLMAVYAAIAVAGIVSREIDRGTAEFLFSLPVDRPQVVLARFAVFASNVVLLHGAVLAGGWFGAAGLHLAFPLIQTLRVLWLSVLVTLALSGGLLLWSIFVPDYGRALFGGMGAAVALYVVAIALRASGKAAALLPWLIFGRFDAGAAMQGDLPLVEDSAILLGTALLLAVAAATAFAERDLKL
jgi:ABC-type transport system involved in multi-copper enzyme maturation permease subunit